MRKPIELHNFYGDRMMIVDIAEINRIEETEQGCALYQKNGGVCYCKDSLATVMDKIREYNLNYLGLT